MWILIVLVAVLALIVIGGLIVGLTLKMLGILITGLIVGALARLVLPGAQGVGILATVLYGVGGALLGAIVANIFDFGWLLEYLLAIVAAAVLISVFSAATPRRTA